MKFYLFHFVKMSNKGCKNNNDVVIVFYHSIIHTIFTKFRNYVSTKRKLSQKCIYIYKLSYCYHCIIQGGFLGR